MLPLLKFAGDRQEHKIHEAITHIASVFNLTEQDRKEILPSGSQRILDNRVSWARTYLQKAGLLESPRRSYFKITEAGREVLNDPPTEINVKFLEQFPQFINFKNIKKVKEKSTIPPKATLQTLLEDVGATPQELLEHGYQEIKKDLSQKLLDEIKQNSPQFFEKLVVELLLSMGYGGSQIDAGQAVGQSSDGGIDGIIKEDKLGLDVIYLQAKRWENVVGSSQIRNFVGSLVGRKANKGVFITTSGFTKESLKFAGSIEHKVILIDGEMLVRLMIENNVGVSKVTSYDIKKVDSDYFVE